MAAPVARLNRTVEVPASTNVNNITVQAVQAHPFKIEGVGNLRALATLGEEIAWVGGSEGKIAKTEDGGRTWEVCPIPDGEMLDIRAIYLVNPQVACAMNAGRACDGLARVYRTVDGGKHWKLVLNSDVDGIFFDSMVFWNEKKGILLSDPVQGRFVLFKTEDGGETWERIIPIEMPFAMPGEGAFAASNSCLAVQGTDNVWFATGAGPSARVFYSTDSGKHWQVSDTPMKNSSPISGIFSLSFLDDQVGIAVGGDHRDKTSFPGPNILITNDGGRNWKPYPVEHLQKRYLSSVAWKSDRSVIVIDGSQERLNAVVTTKTGGWAIGPNQAFTKF